MVNALPVISWSLAGTPGFFFLRCVGLKIGDPVGNRPLGLIAVKCDNFKVNGIYWERVTL